MMLVPYVQATQVRLSPLLGGSLVDAIMVEWHLSTFEMQQVRSKSSFAMTR
jgi:hypothetical protein